jgi:hypothetical protein
VTMKPHIKGCLPRRPTINAATVGPKPGDTSEILADREGDEQPSTLWLNADFVVDCATKLLFAAQISLGRLDRNMAKQKLNLQFAAR